MIIVKRTDTTGDWQVYHRANTANPETDYLVLNSTDATADSNTRWNDTQPTSIVFSLGTEATVNASGGSYVAYLFAHDAGGFGETGDDNIVSCGSFTAGIGEVTLGYEPQWIMFKSTSTTGGWIMFDTMRGWVNSPDIGGTQFLQANTSGAEGATGLITFQPTATGFKYNLTADYIYLAIRRPNKPPESGTEVFAPVTYTGDGTSNRLITSGFATDTSWILHRSSTSGQYTHDRLRGGGRGIRTSQAQAEFFDSGLNNQFQTNQGVLVTALSTVYNASSVTHVSHQFRRAPGFFDVVCYTGTGIARTVPHNLTVAPEMMIVKKRNAQKNWMVYQQSASTGYFTLNTTAALQTSAAQFIFGDGSSVVAPTSSVFSLGSNDVVNGSGQTYVAYLFASLDGISKVGSYTGTGTTQAINCGFTNGARFVMIKATSTTGDWLVWDTARGIVSGNDPYLRLNTTAAEVTSTDYIDPLASGFELSNASGNLANTNGVSYIFYAVA
jgi:hypothetical protein